MPLARYEIVGREDHFVVRHDEDVTGPYVTKEAAFEAAVSTAGHAMAEGYAVEVIVPAGAEGRRSGNA
ncbi:hypothetical protein SAMN02745157_3904 [Kaistia soli DSM 19436]|uniref:DUF2188 domain-containing protein n=1 Tax=Kaistia soli DSM 19436 TaxID=1122133 RepID=A0A1M5IIM3_9HYPH|nr:hypothetical protein [Kaistia soli]SHG28224.1 hypothetical protein SAMN02745157_3904 [Kaistia soli DSM 19436]